MARLTTPVAVLLGAGLIGVCVAIGIFAALRGRPSTAPSALDLPPPPDIARPSTPPTGDTASASPAFDSARRALLAQHEKLVATCWTPLATKGPAVASVDYSLRLSFNASGQQATKAFLSPVVGFRLDITKCIASTLAPLTIPPQDAGVSLEIPLRLP